MSTDTQELLQLLIKHCDGDLLLAKEIMLLLANALKPSATTSDSSSDLASQLLAAAVITPLSGGITNQNYLIELNDEKFVLRVGGKGTELLGINRKHEHLASRIAAQLGIGAEVIFSDDSINILLTSFISGQLLTSKSAAEPEILRQVAHCLQCYHNGPHFPGIFSPFETVRNYHKLATSHGVSFPYAVDRALVIMERLERALESKYDLRPCHNDLLSANFIDDGVCIRLIDWEYAAMGDPFFDLGNFAVNQELSEESSRQLLEFYFGKVTQDDLIHLELMRLASDLRESFWGFLQSGLSTLNFDFREYALKHLDRFLKNVADSPIINR
ncbi:MAG: phosphotransferase [Acidobacteriota bacterium]